MNKNDQEFLVQKIRTQYTEKEHTNLDELKALDRKVKRPANVFAYVGIGDPMIPGIAIGVAGMLMAIVNYPLYKSILGARRKKYADRIIALSDQIMKG